MSNRENIKSLPEAYDIKDGDFLLVENQDGTQILDYQNFIISEYNTTFSQLLSSHSADGSNNLTYIKQLSSNQDTLSGFWNTDTSSQIYTLSSVNIISTASSTALTVHGNISGTGDMILSGIVSAADIGGSSYFAGKVGIGSTLLSHRNDAPDVVVDYYYSGADNLVIAEAGNAGITIATGETDTGFLYFTDDTLIKGGYRGGIGYYHDPAEERLSLVTGGTEKVTILPGGDVGIGTKTPDTNLHIASLSACMTLKETESKYSVTVPQPDVNAEARIFVRRDRLVVQYNDSGTTRFKYLVLTGTNVAWEHTTEGNKLTGDI